MADIICRWRNGTPKTVVELVNSLPHTVIPNSDFRDYMADKWDGDFFRTPYQLACQLALYYESDDGNYYPRFNHDITIEEAQEYLELWLPRYYVPNPYVRRDGFNEIDCPTYVLHSLYEYAKQHPHCTYSEAYLDIFHEEATNNNDIVRNYINNYSKVLRFETNGELKVTDVNPNTIFNFMERNNKKAFFENFDNSNKQEKHNSLPRQVIYFGAPGTGKSYRIDEITKQCEQNVIRTTFHPDSDYSTFVGCYKPTMKAIPQTYANEGNEKPIIGQDGKQVIREEIAYSFVPQAFTQAYIKAWQNPNENIYLVIEEINRGNCAQIFGDIFQLLDRDEDGKSSYKIRPDKDLQEYLQKELADRNQADCVPEDIKSGAVMRLPQNLYIWATMNTSDQSLFPIDSAFKRRWLWKYMPISDAGKGYKIEVGSKQYDWWQFVEKVNNEIEGATKSEDKKLGYFFAKAEDNIISADTFVSKVVFYLWNDVFKDSYDKTIFKGDMTFHKFFEPSGEPKLEVIEQFMTDLGLEPITEE